MKKILRNSILASGLFLFAVLLGSGCRGKEKKHEHAQMNHDAVHDSLSHLVKPTDEGVVGNVKTIKAQRGSRFQDVSARGIISYNENNLSSQSARVSGRIEHLFIKFNYQSVSKGQKIMEIYSPDLVNAQQELLFLYRNKEPELAEMAKRKLVLLGATPQQISRLLKTGEVSYTFVVYSSTSGYIVENLSSGNEITGSSGATVIGSASGSGSDGMASMGSSASSSPEVPAVPTSSPLQLREGQYVSQGQSLFKIIKTNDVWVEFYIQPEQLEIFKRGTKITVSSTTADDKAAESLVSLVQPYYSSGSSYPLVRAVLPNSRKSWRIGEIVRVSKEEVKKNGVWLPKTAVLSLGGRSVSFVKQGAMFVPVDVSINGYAGEWVDIGESLGDREVAMNAWFLMDSESFIQVQK